LFRPSGVKVRTDVCRLVHGEEDDGADVTRV